MTLPIKNVVLEYFAFRSRGEPIRLLLHDAGIPFEDVEVDDRWGTLKQNNERCLFGQVPICEIDGLVLVQRDAILRYIARRVGYTTDSTEEEARADMLAGLMDDMDFPYQEAVWAPEEEVKTQLINVATTDLPKYLECVERVFCKRASPKGFLAYKETPCFSEFLLLHNLLAYTILRPTILDDFPLLKKWHNMMLERKGIKAYIGSGKLRARINPKTTADAPVC